MRTTGLARIKGFAGTDYLRSGISKVCYRYGKGAAELERMDTLEFIVRVTSHIPDKGQVTIRYFGLYANSHRGKVRKSEELAHKVIIMVEECPYRGGACRIYGYFATSIGSPAASPRPQACLDIPLAMSDYLS